ncbi:thioredoxin domain-containing protein [Omnitrophica bacterium]|nr:thioredoxin domain-containing protein [Candidatus Omnitrophota bacterium]
MGNAPRSAGSEKNQLAQEKSPYLLQHADNPVHWRPWSDEAFEQARQTDRPVFLSIGYFACHWCHVMEKESFENPEIADFLNRHFVSIKVDREERPDVDKVYMNAVMKMTGSGGWPLTVFLTPDREPFYGGTYFPPEDRHGRRGFLSLLLQVHEFWTHHHEDLKQSASTLLEAMNTAAPSAESADDRILSEKPLKLAYERLESQFDSEYGGFGHAPKFPRPHELTFLLRYARRFQNEKALDMTTFTFKKMAEGGLRDHLGGGFHRYATDKAWQVPHFEKMLYDQALLSTAYLEAHQVTKDPYYAEVAKETLDFVLEHMMGPDGGFYTALDADSADTASPDAPHKEGEYYLWGYDEFKDLVSKRDFPVLAEYYSLAKEGNAGLEFPGKNILYMPGDSEQIENTLNRTRQEIQDILKKAKPILLEHRAKRPPPALDKKILTDTNGLMIASLALAYRVTGEVRYRDAAKKTAAFIRHHLWTEKDGLLHRYYRGHSGIPGFADDYAFLAYGLFELYQSTFEPEYLKDTLTLLKRAQSNFWDAESGGFFFTADSAKGLVARSKELYDGAIPSANSIFTWILLRAGRLTMNSTLTDYADNTLTSFYPDLAKHPEYFPQMLTSLEFQLGPTREIVIAGNPEDFETRRFVVAVHQRFLPDTVTALHPIAEKDSQAILEIIPFLKNQKALQGKTTAYVCVDYVCRFPSTSVEQFEEQLKASEPA